MPCGKVAVPSRWKSRGIGQQRAMQLGRVADAARSGGTRPAGRAGASAGSVRRADTRGGTRTGPCRDSQRCTLGGSAPAASGDGAGASARCPRACGTSGIDSWCSAPASASWNEAAQKKIGLPCWIAVTRRTEKLLAVAGAVDVVDDRVFDVAGAQEVGVQRVHGARPWPDRSCCAADSAWPSTWPPNTYLVPMSRLWPRNRLSSSRSSESSSISSGRRVRSWVNYRAAGLSLDAPTDRCRAAAHMPLRECTGGLAVVQGRRCVASGTAVRSTSRPREQRAGIALAAHLQRSGRRWRRLRRGPGLRGRRSNPAKGCRACSVAQQRQQRFDLGLGVRLVHRLLARIQPVRVAAGVDQFDADAARVVATGVVGDALGRHEFVRCRRRGRCSSGRCCRCRWRDRGCARRIRARWPGRAARCSGSPQVDGGQFTCRQCIDVGQRAQADAFGLGRGSRHAPMLAFTHWSTQPPPIPSSAACSRSSRAPGGCTGSACARPATCPCTRSTRPRPTAGKGLAGDRYGSGSGKRGITLIQAEHLPVIAALSGHRTSLPATAASQRGGLRHSADRAEGPAFPHRRGAAGRHRPLRSVFAHGSGARRPAATTRCAAWAACARASSRAAPARGRCGGSRTRA